MYVYFFLRRRINVRRYEIVAIYIYRIESSVYDSTERLPTVGRFYIYFGIKKNIWSGFRSQAHT